MEYYLNVYIKYMFINLLENVSKYIFKRIVILFFTVAISNKNEIILMMLVNTPADIYLAK